MTDQEAFDLWYIKLLEPWEGGIADRPLKDDPGGLTNRGVTISVWRQQGFDNDFDGDIDEWDLRVMTKAQALLIAKRVYWDFYLIPKINNPAIKILVAESVWGGGGYKSLGYKTGTTSLRVAQINADSAKDKTLFDKMINNRVIYLKSLDNYPVNAKGWLNRVLYGDSYRLSLRQLVDKYKLNSIAVVAATGIGGLLVGTGIFFLIRNIMTSNTTSKNG